MFSFYMISQKLSSNGTENRRKLPIFCFFNVKLFYVTNQPEEKLNDSKLSNSPRMAKRIFSLSIDLFINSHKSSNNLPPLNSQMAENDCSHQN